MPRLLVDGMSPASDKRGEIGAAATSAEQSANMSSRPDLQSGEKSSQLAGAQTELHSADSSIATAASRNLAADSKADMSDAAVAARAPSAAGSQQSQKPPTEQLSYVSLAEAQQRAERMLQQHATAEPLRKAAPEVKWSAVSSSTPAARAPSSRQAAQDAVAG